MSAATCQQVAREIQLHAELSHPGIIGLYAAFEAMDAIYLVQEFAPGGDVYGFLGRSGGYLKEDVAVNLVLQPFISALAYLHGKGIMHRDIKPENLLLGKEGKARLADFGLALDVGAEVAKSRVGTLDYMAPEGHAHGHAYVMLIVKGCLPGEQKREAYGLPADVWAAGGTGGRSWLRGTLIKSVCGAGSAEGALPATDRSDAGSRPVVDVLRLRRRSTYVHDMQLLACSEQTYQTCRTNIV
eukprot:jgi/Botrbrau1/14932/Bobra.0018s0036.1